MKINCPQLPEIQKSISITDFNAFKFLVRSNQFEFILNACRFLELLTCARTPLLE